MDDHERDCALELFPAEPGNQVARAHLLARRGELTLGGDWAVLLWEDELCLGGDPFSSPLEPGSLQSEVEVDVCLSCGLPARSRITGEPGETTALHALPPEGWVGFCYAASGWEALLRRAFVEVRPWSRVGFIGAETHEAPRHPTRPLEPGDVEDLVELNEPWLYKYHAGPRGLIDEGLAFGALVEGRVRGVAALYAADERYADIAAATHPAFRRRGLGRAAVSALAAALSSRGLIPFWETTAGHTASVRIPLSLGWRPVELPAMYTINRRPPEV